MKNKRVRGRKYKSKHTKIKKLQHSQMLDKLKSIIQNILKFMYNNKIAILFIIIFVLLIFNSTQKIQKTNDNIDNLTNQIQQLQDKLETEYVTKQQSEEQLKSIQEQVNNTKSSITDVQTKVDNTSKEVNNIKTTSRGGLTTRQTNTTNNNQTTTSSTNTTDYIAFTATGYCPCSKCCGKTNGITAMGTKATQGKTVAMSSKYAFGTKVEIKGMGTYTVEDRGGAIQGNKIDIYFNTHSQALAFGRKTVYLKIIK